MTVPLFMGWVLLALLVLLVVLLMVVTLISGRAGSPVVAGSSPGLEVPVNVFQRGALPVHSAPGQPSAPANHSDPFGSAAAARPGGAGQHRRLPGLGADPSPMYAPSPMGAPSPMEAEARTVGQPGKTRSPVAVWLLPLVTFGVYSLVWYYKINRELRDLHPSIQVDPALALLALFVPIANLVSMYRTGQRIAQAQQLAGLEPSCSGGLGVLAWFVFGLNALYYQSQLNGVWAQQRA
jgi:Domain of unknown function (DUF4234)